MTLPPPIERDTSGRFVKPETDEPVGEMADDDMHPMARLLFGWVEAKRTPMILLFSVLLLSAILIMVDPLLHRHDEAEIAHITGFYGIWGFGSFALAVLSGWPLGKLLRRSEDYYGEAETTPQDVEGDQ